MENLDIRLIIKENRLTFAEVAEEMGITRFYLSNLMSKPLRPDMRLRILAAVDDLMGRRCEDGSDG